MGDKVAAGSLLLSKYGEPLVPFVRADGPRPALIQAALFTPVAVAVASASSDLRSPGAPIARHGARPVADTVATAPRGPL